jgi:hypothetical protein
MYELEIFSRVSEKNMEFTNIEPKIVAAIISALAVYSAGSKIKFKIKNIARVENGFSRWAAAGLNDVLAANLN